MPDPNFDPGPLATRPQLTKKWVETPDGSVIDVDVAEGQDPLLVAKQKHEAQIKERAKASPTGESNFSDFLKSLPTGLAEGFADAVALAGKAELGTLAAATGDPEIMKGAPSGEEAKQVLEKATGPLHQPSTRGGRIGEEVAKPFGDPLTYLGPGGMGMKALQAAGGGLGAGVMGEWLKGTALEPYAKFLGGFAGGTAAGTAGVETSLAALNRALPNLDRFKAAAKAGYDQLKNLGARITDKGAGDLAFTIRDTLGKEQFRRWNAKGTFRALEELEDKVAGGMDMGDIDGIRRLFGKVDVTKPEDRKAANRAIALLDGWLMNVDPAHVAAGDPEFAAVILKQAQGNWAVVRRLQEVEKAKTIALHRAGVSGTGANMINTQRQEIRKILDSEKRSRGMSQEVKDKMEEIVMGTWLTNRARYFSKWAPTGVVSAMFNMIAGSKIPGVGAATTVTGLLSKYMGEHLTDKQIKELETIIKGEGPIGKPIAAAQAGQREELEGAFPLVAARSAAVSADEETGKQ